MLVRKLPCGAALAGLALCAPATALAQATVTVTGVVRESASQPIAGALVFVDEGSVSTLTDSLGMFRLEGVAPAVHALHYRSAGFAPRSFNLDLTAVGTSRDLGAVALQPGPAPTATLRGTVTESAGGQPLAGAVVALNGQTIAVSDSAGAFAVSGAYIRWGANQVRVTHMSLSEASSTDELWMMNPGETFELAVTLDVPPIALPAVSVEAARVRYPRLEVRGFFDRKEDSSNGVFLTRDEIAEREPRDWDDLFRGIRFARTRAAGTFGNAQGGVCGRTAEPLAFLEGAYIGELSALVESVMIESIEGIEIYRGVAGLPTEFNLMGAECGVVVVWTGRSGG